MPYDRTDEAMARERGLNPTQIRSLQERFGLANAEIAELPEGRLAQLLRKIDLPDQPRARARYQMLFEMGDLGAPLAVDKTRALRQLSEARARMAAGVSMAGVPSGAGVVAASLSPPPLPLGAGLSPTGAGWVSLGPGGVGGRTRAIIVDPGNPDRIWAASVGGGVWLTANGGANWFPVDDRMANLAVACMAIDPANPQVLYAGTGEGFLNVDALRGAGIFRTVDGTTWSQLDTTVNSDFHYVNRLAVSADGVVLLAATRTGIFRSESPNRDDWQKVASGDVADVAFHPTDPELAVAGGLRDGTALFSEDGGASWQDAAGMPAGSGRVELTYALADPGIVYASVDVAGGRILRSSDGGRTYVQRAGAGPTGSAAQYLGQQGWYDNALWAGDPIDPNLLVLGGIDLWRSTDGGGSLTRISDWRQDASAHSDHHAIVSHPGYDGAVNRTVFFGNDGGIYRADDVTTVGSDADRTVGWANLVNGYAVTQFYGAAGNPATGTLIGGAQDNGTLSFRPTSGVSAWIEILGGDGGYCAADPGDPDVFYSEYVFLDLHRNTNGASGLGNWWENYISGRFFNPASNQWDMKPVPFQIPDAREGRALFIAPFTLDPNAPDRLLAGGLSLWRTDDAKTPNTDASGPSWQSIKGSVGSPISAVTVAQGDSDRVWVGHVNGEVYRARDATADTPAWDLVRPGSAAGEAPNRMCTRIVVDPHDHDRVYVTFAGYSPDNVWATEDDGATWRSLAASLPEAPIRCLAIHPRRASHLYLGTEMGIFTSEDFGATWSPTNEGPTNCAVSDLIWMDEVLVCATHGRGMFSIDLSGLPNGP